MEGGCHLLEGFFLGVDLMMVYFRPRLYALSGEERTAPGRDQLRRIIGLCPVGDTTRPTAEGRRKPGAAEQDTCVWDRAGPHGPRPPAPGPALPPARR